MATLFPTKEVQGKQQLHKPSNVTETFDPLLLGVNLWYTNYIPVHNVMPDCSNLLCEYFEVRQSNGCSHVILHASASVSSKVAALQSGIVSLIGYE